MTSMRQLMLVAAALMAGGSALAEPPLPPDLTGSWALEIASVSAAKVPIIGSLKSTSRTWVLLELRVQGDGLVADHRVCSTEVSGGLVRTRVPQGFVAAVAPKHYPVVLSAHADGWHYDADTQVYSMGYDRDCSAQPPLTADDPCVRDVDGDGHPGATVHAKAPAFPWVQVYVAQRARPVLTGRVISVDQIQGDVDLAELNTVVLGASNRLFASSPQVTPLPAQSHFQQARLPAGATCVDVLRHFGAESPLP